MNESSLCTILLAATSGLEAHLTGLSGEAGAILGDRWNGMGALLLEFSGGEDTELGKQLVLSGGELNCK